MKKTSLKIIIGDFKEAKALDLISFVIACIGIGMSLLGLGFSSGINDSTNEVLNNIIYTSNIDTISNLKQYGIVNDDIREYKIAELVRQYEDGIKEISNLFVEMQNILNEQDYTTIHDSNEFDCNTAVRVEFDKITYEEYPNALAIEEIIYNLEKQRRNLYNELYTIFNIINTCIINSEFESDIEQTLFEVNHSIAYLFTDKLKSEEQSLKILKNISYDNIHSDSSQIINVLNYQLKELYQIGLKDTYNNNYKTLMLEQYVNDMMNIFNLSENYSNGYIDKYTYDSELNKYMLDIMEYTVSYMRIQDIS